MKIVYIIDYSHDGLYYIHDDVFYTLRKAKKELRLLRKSNPHMSPDGFNIRKAGLEENGSDDTKWVK